MKKYILIIAFLLWTLPLSIYGVEESILLNADSETLDIGSVLKVRVDVKDKLEIKGIELYLKYDKSYLTPVDTAFTKGILIDEEYFYTGINNVNSQKGTIRFMGTSLRGGSPIIGDGELLTFNLKTIKTGKTPIQLRNIKIIDGDMKTLRLRDQTIDIQITSSRNDSRTSNNRNSTNNNTDLTLDKEGINIRGKNVDNLIVAIGLIPSTIQDDIILVSEAYDIQHKLHSGEGRHKLENPIEIRIKYNDKENIDEYKLGLYYFNEEKDKWIYIGGEVDRDNKTITATINHLTKFAVFKNPSMKELEDINDHWSNNYVKRLLGMNVITGFEDGSFKPDKHVSREEFSKFIVLALDLEISGDEISFTDKNEIQFWAKDYVHTVYENNILIGYGDGSFRPKAPMTRMEAALALGKILGDTGNENYYNTLEDMKEVPPWAVDQIKKSIAAGIIHGYEDNTFKPHNPVTRGEAVKMIYMTLWELGI